MANRNPSRTGKSEKEKQFLNRQIKGISSSDTSKTESPFDPSNVIADDKTPKPSTRNRPQPFMRKAGNHFKKNSAAYIICLITVAAGFVITPPFYNLNREVGEVKIEVKSIKEGMSAELNNANQRIFKLSDQLADLLDKIASIKTYLVNKFRAKF
jgi:hypothetical protein